MLKSRFFCLLSIFICVLDCAINSLSDANIEICGPGFGPSSRNDGPVCEVHAIQQYCVVMNQGL